MKGYIGQDQPQGLHVAKIYEGWKNIAEDHDG
jgi:hypothetical protein